MQEYRGEVVQLATRIPQPLHRAIRVRAIEESRPLGEFVSEALAEHLARLQGHPMPTPQPGKLTTLAATRRLRPKRMPPPNREPTT
jgi:hypothetical protein